MISKLVSSSGILAFAIFILESIVMHMNTPHQLSNVMKFHKESIFYIYISYSTYVALSFVSQEKIIWKLCSYNSLFIPTDYRIKLRAYLILNGGVAPLV